MIHFLAMAYRSTERTEARRVAVRSRVLAAAHELIAEGGYVNAPIAAVAERAGVAVGTVYRHFPSKSELFAEVFREASQREVDAMRAAAAAFAGDGAAQRIAAGTETFARRALAGRRLAWALLAEPVDPAVEAERLQFRQSYRDVIAEIVADGVAVGDLPEQDPEATGAALVGAIGEAMLGPLSPAYDGSFLDQTGRSSRSALALRPRTDGGDPEELVASLITFCKRAIGVEPTRDGVKSETESHVNA